MKQLIGALLIACACSCSKKQDEAQQVDPKSAQPGKVWKQDRKALDEYISKFREPEGGGDWQGAPVHEDHVYAAIMDKNVQKIAKQYIISQPNYKDPWADEKMVRPPGDIEIVAAREMQGYTLLDVAEPGVKDGNSHLIYCPVNKRIEGKFYWYPQG